jgi:hypothetical protein
MTASREYKSKATIILNFYVKLHTPVGFTPRQKAPNTNVMQRVFIQTEEMKRNVIKLYRLAELSQHATAGVYIYI